MKTSLAITLLAALAAGCAGVPRQPGAPPESAAPRSDDGPRVFREPPPVLTREGQARRRGTPFFAGAYLGDALTTPGTIRRAIREYAEAYGQRPALVKSFHRVRSDWGPSEWVGQLMREVQAAGSTNYIGLAIAPQIGMQTDTVLDFLLAGRMDADIRRAARDIAGFGDLVLIEPAWEMNGNWDYRWQGTYNTPDAAGKFVAVWRRLVDLFREEGADNIRWVFNPNTGNPLTTTSTGPDHWNWYGYYYPGDEYVDYVGVHAYNAPQLWNTEWRNLSDLIAGPLGDNAVPDMKLRFPDKPIILGEIGSEEGPPGWKAQWMRDAYDVMTRDERIVGAVWFDMNKETDWRIASSPATAEAYRDILAHRWIVTVFTDPARNAEIR